MESFFTRFKNGLVLIAILLAQTIVLAVQVRRPAGAGSPEGHKIRLIRVIANASFTPFERLAHSLSRGVRSGWADYVDLRRVRSQNQALRQQIAQLRLDQAALAQDALEGQRLQVLLNFQQHYIASTVAAQIIATSGTESSRVATLDKGRDDGLRTDMAVLTPDGIVGKLRDVYQHTSQLLLLSDQTSGAGVMLESTRIRAIVRGSATGRLQINNLMPDERIKPGEVVLTSGGDLVYPRGLKVGVIESVALDPDHLPYTAIVVKPSANLTRLEEVLVITASQSALPPQTQQDLTQAVLVGKATAAATAQAVAEAVAQSRHSQEAESRLPGLYATPPASPLPGSEPDPTASSRELPAIADPIPQPDPVLRPDRYTPGSTPPANALAPGAPR